MKKKILIVDDSRVVLQAFSNLLQHAGYEVLTAPDGGDAVSLVRREQPDLVLLDISFPPDVAHGGGVAWDAFVIMSWLRRLEEGKNVPVIIVTAGDPAQYQDRALAAGALKFFQKPLDPEELLAAIREILDQAPAPPVDATA